MNRTAWIFPGQGAQFVGMGRDLYGAFPPAKRVFDTADEVLGFPLSRLCFEGPLTELTNTFNAQPATYTMSVACMEAMGDRIHEVPGYVAGHSLGEYTALVAAGVIDFTDGLRLVRERGRLMQQIPQTCPEGMAAIIGLDSAAVDKICTRAESEMPGSYVRVVNYNTPQQLVVSGSIEAVRLCIKLAEEHGSILARLLTVSRAFHSEFMRPVASELQNGIAALNFQDARIPVVSNITGMPLTMAEEIKAELVNQVFSPVQWTRSVEYMIAAGVDHFIEFGPGRVLTGLVKNIADTLPKLTNLGSEKAIASF